LEKRRRGLELFLSTVLLMPEVGASPIVKKVYYYFLQKEIDGQISGGSSNLFMIPWRAQVEMYSNIKPIPLLYK